MYRCFSWHVQRAQWHRTRKKKRNKDEKGFLSIARSLLVTQKQKAATLLRAGSEAASEPGHCNHYRWRWIPCTYEHTSLSNSSTVSLTTGKLSPLKRTSNSYFDSINQTENSQLVEILARVIFPSGSPLSIFENEDWMTFMEKLRPIYKLTSRFTLSNNLLE